jgi:adenosylmethionine---8-amino-7-oxononanoate aminotransferase
MKHHAVTPPLPLVPIARGEGVYLIDVAGKRYIDGVSSWWVNLFGHTNPRINAALKDQLDTLEHTMLAGFTHTPAVELAERLSALTGLGHAFYASDGASAVEIALKMSFHFWQNQGVQCKTKFVSLEGSYHGETLGALSVTDVAIFRDQYAPLLHNNLRVAAPTPLSVVENCDAPCCEACAIAAAEKLAALLETHHAEIAAVIIEPLVQGAAGMRMFHPEYLRRARALTAQHGVHLIVDEIMTGFGRTGSMFAWQQANTSLPDFMCLSKGITGGYLPLSCVLTTDTVFDAFYDNSSTRGFLHSHSYTGSALACRAALATLDIFASDNVIATNHVRAARFSQLAAPLKAHARIRHFRQLGMIQAFEVDQVPTDFSRHFFTAALAAGVLLRPIGNTVYFMPPYIITDDEFMQMVNVTLNIINTLPPC